MPPAEVTEEGIPALVTGQQLELGVSSPCPSVADQGPAAYAAAAVIGEPAQGHRQLTLGSLGEGVIGRVARVPLRGSLPRRLSPLVQKRLQLLGHGGRHSTVNGVRPQKNAPLPSVNRASTATLP